MYLPSFPSRLNWTTSFSSSFIPARRRPLLVFLYLLLFASLLTDTSSALTIHFNQGYDQSAAHKYSIATVTLTPEDVQACTSLFTNRNSVLDPYTSSLYYSSPDGTTNRLVRATTGQLPAIVVSAGKAAGIASSWNSLWYRDVDPIFIVPEAERTTYKTSLLQKIANGKVSIVGCQLNKGSFSVRGFGSSRLCALALAKAMDYNYIALLDDNVTGVQFPLNKEQNLQAITATSLLDFLNENVTELSKWSTLGFTPNSSSNLQNTNGNPLLKITTPKGWFPQQFFVINVKKLTSEMNDLTGFSTAFVTSSEDMSFAQWLTLLNMRPGKMVGYVQKTPIAADPGMAIPLDFLSQSVGSQETLWKVEFDTLKDADAVFSPSSSGKFNLEGFVKFVNETYNRGTGTEATVDNITMSRHFSILVEKIMLACMAQMDSQSGIFKNGHQSLWNSVAQSFTYIPADGSWSKQWETK